jgi:hypothetical protein
MPDTRRGPHGSCGGPVSGGSGGRCGPCRAERPALEAVAAQRLGCEAGAGDAGLNDASDGPGIDGRAADAGQGGVAVVAAVGRGPDPPEHPPLGGRRLGSGRVRSCSRGWLR